MSHLRVLLTFGGEEYSVFIEPARKTPGLSHEDTRAVPFGSGLGGWGNKGMQGFDRKARLLYTDS
ncbi:hypothetical protein Krac_7328 [Ktedonobacter racemifer DSM 44963]|uniref:Uncharacterized protein n=1 Tax=Ktedonobacter racemifer DSM 44963 TaxID=485913 RepID=D6TRY8_KTERA|nr:hypothetical protein Krac_7328 [Ktedonobacter racemifer DSM 44963]